MLFPERCELKCDNTELALDRLYRAVTRHENHWREKELSNNRLSSRDFSSEQNDDAPHGIPVRKLACIRLGCTVLGR
jgi:hypothetical protein